MIGPHISGFFRIFASPHALLTLSSLLWAVNWVVGRAIRHDSGPNALVLGERPESCHAAGFVLVPIGLALTNRRRA